MMLQGDQEEHWFVPYVMENIFLCEEFIKLSIPDTINNLNNHISSQCLSQGC